MSETPQEARAKLQELGYQLVSIPDGFTGFARATLLLHPDGSVTWIRPEDVS